MRSLVVIFFFFVLFFGVGSILLSTDTQAQSNMDDITVSLGEITSGHQISQQAISTVVDRDDDSDITMACTADPNDCNLRSAVNIANSDGKKTTITFAGSYLIRLSRPLPALSEDETSLIALPGQEVHIAGNGTAASALRITGAHIVVEGLRIYGAGAGYPNIAVSEDAYDVIIANNIIGDDDAPRGNCGSNDSAYGGIYIDATGDFGHGIRTWIYGNVIECNRGVPGDGITIRSDKVLVGKDPNGSGAASQRNFIRSNNGFGVNLMDATGNTVCDNELVENMMGGLYISNYHNNNIMFNDIIDYGLSVN